MGTPRIRCDEEGFHIVTNGEIYRPGAINGHGHALRMDDGGLEAGGIVKATAIAGTELARLTLADGSITYWHVEGSTRNRGLMETPKDAIWNQDGRRDFKRAAVD